MLKKLLNKSISDSTIPLFFSVLWFLSLVFLFSMDINMHNRSLIESFSVFLKFPMISAFFFFWLKANIIAWIRIQNKETMTMPGFEYFAYGLQYFTLWTTNDVVFNSLTTRLGEPGNIGSLIFHQQPILFWLVLEIISTLVFLPRYYSKFNVHGVHKRARTESILMFDVLRALITFVLAILIYQFLFWI